MCRKREKVSVDRKTHLSPILGFLPSGMGLLMEERGPQLSILWRFMMIREAQGTSLLLEVGWGCWNHLKKWRKEKSEFCLYPCLCAASLHCHLSFALMSFTRAIWEIWGWGWKLRPGAGGEAEKGDFHAEDLKGSNSNIPKGPDCKWFFPGPCQYSLCRKVALGEELS